MQRPNPMLGVSGSIRMAPFRMGTFELIPMWVTSFLAFGWSISKHSLQSDGRHAEA